MIKVHHLEHSRSQRILWLLEELDVDYEVRHYARDAETQLAPPELLKVHPLGKSPVITDGDKTIAETGTIIEYLLEVHGNGPFHASARQLRILVLQILAPLRGRHAHAADGSVTGDPAY